MRVLAKSERFPWIPRDKAFKKRYFPYKNNHGPFRLLSSKQLQENSTEDETKDVYQQRLEVYRNGCNDAKRKFQLNLLKSGTYFVYEDNTKLIYCYAPKVGSTNWLKLWLVLLGVINSTQADNMHHSVVRPKYFKHIPLLKRLNETEKNKRLENYLKFIFVRHPFKRLLSAFRDKFESADRLKENFVKIHGTKIIRRYRAGGHNMPEEEVNNLRQYVQFKEFVQYVIDTAGTSEVDGHWKPINQLCSVCSINIDVIGKFENLEEDTLYVLKRAGVDDDTVSFPKFDTRATNSSTTDLLRRYYSSISKDNILNLYDVYKRDFILFGYPFPDEFIQWSTST
ncbi:carbohydrate sulfotransferase 11-like [Glandiceps talaboti]